MRTLVLIALLLVVGSCATNPVTGESELSLVSESQEISMGKSYSAEVRQSIGDYPDSNVQRYVNNLGQSIAAKTERSQLKWEFHVIDDPAVNAFALPGGFIFVTRGLMTHLNSDAELATVLGHEAGHVAAKHSVKQISQQQLMLLGLGIGAAVSPNVRKYSGELSAGMGLLFLKFSRDDETQADQLGFRYALADGYDSRQMINVFQMLDAVSHESDGGHLPEWQSTHPNPGSRIQNTEQLIAKSTQNFNNEKLGKSQYLHLVDGMTFGENPRNGYFNAGLFLHPDLKFQFQFPAGWKTQNGAEAVTAASAPGDAMMELRIVPGTISSAAQAFFSKEGLVSKGSQSTSVHGNSGIVVAFHTQSGQTPVEGLVLFLDYVFDRLIALNAFD